jgi:hypothetical protein
MPSSGWTCWWYVAVYGCVRTLVVVVVAVTVAVGDNRRPSASRAGVESGLPRHPKAKCEIGRPPAGLTSVPGLPPLPAGPTRPQLDCMVASLSKQQFTATSCEEDTAASERGRQEQETLPPMPRLAA